MPPLLCLSAFARLLDVLEMTELPAIVLEILPLGEFVLGWSPQKGLMDPENAHQVRSVRDKIMIDVEQSRDDCYHDSHSHGDSWSWSDILAREQHNHSSDCPIVTES